MYKLCTIESKQKEIPIDWRIKDDHPPEKEFLDSNPFRSLRDNVVMLGMHGAFCTTCCTMQCTSK